MKNLIVCAALAAGLAFLPTGAFAAAAGHVTDLDGMATDTHAGASVALKNGDAVNAGDLIQTAEKSRVKIVFADETEVTVGETGKFMINSYAYDPGHPDAGKADMSVLNTAFSYIGGLLDKTKKPDVTLHLNFGSIGIRGTKIFRAMHNGQCWIYVERGRIDVSNKGGAVHLKEGQGTIMMTTTKAPAAAHIWSAKEIAWIKGQVADPRLHQNGWQP